MRKPGSSCTVTDGIAFSQPRCSRKPRLKAVNSSSLVASAPESRELIDGCCWYELCLDVHFPIHSMGPPREGKRETPSNTAFVVPSNCALTLRTECPATHAVKARSTPPFAAIMFPLPGASRACGRRRCPRSGRPVVAQSRSGAQPQIARAWPALPFVSISVHSWGKSWSQYPVVS